MPNYGPRMAWWVSSEKAILSAAAQLGFEKGTLGPKAENVKKRKNWVAAVSLDEFF